ncbi:MAG: threonine synthase [Bacteroidetes bacterium]|nr:threonine synthase [Bacteroidota bacterium]MDA0937651.1 threonine synthase [Bacteroidota bacterium]MDA1344383.1 threonine synthase [Bacteroidota bacterium]
MKYYSLNNPVLEATFKEAVKMGLAPDKGLYFPKEIPALAKDFLERLPNLSKEAIALEVIEPYIGNEIPKAVLKEIIEETLCFDFPIIPVTDTIGSLELFHGPTLAFKDVGARFMARCLGYFNQQDQQTEKSTVLVATSGDTGGAVADGFLGVRGIDVVILYPKGKVSEIQEKQLTTLGKNITALEFDGVFDDCQDMVKTAFLDPEINTKKNLTSANSINVARWLPQMFYYFFAFQALADKNKPLVFSVPSGNFGNLCAGMMAQKMGLPIHHFVASTNSNKVVPEYLKTGNYQTQKTIPTLSNAMDVGAPSNFVRIQKIMNHDFDVLQKHLSGYSYDDTQTKAALARLYKSYNYIADPHGAVGFLGLEAYLNTIETSAYGVFLETAHPIKFLDVVEETLQRTIDMPERLKPLLKREKKARSIDSYAGLKNYLLNTD